MQLLICPPWADYELLDSGNGRRLERFGPYTLVRPDPQLIWLPHLPEEVWSQADAIFQRTEADRGRWEYKNKLFEAWQMRYKTLTFQARLTPFKHTGVFPEQAAHWEWIQTLIKNSQRPVKILNLFGYTGLASLAAAQVGATVTHLDASRPSLTWAKENQEISKLGDKQIRWILDDAIKFVEREVRRGNTYDGILLDPPAYGHGPKGEAWRFREDFPILLATCKKLLTPQPLFFLVNAYAISASSLMLENTLADYVKDLGGKLGSGELAIKEKDTNRLISTGIFARWSKDQ